MSNKQNKADRREAARAEALALQQKQVSRDKRNRVIIFTVLGVAIAALVGVAAFILVNEASKKEVEDVALSEVENVPSTANADGGIPVGSDLVAGTENAGTPTVDVYLDYMCPVCGQFEDVNAADVETMATEGDATVVYYPVSILDRLSRSTEYSTRAAASAYWVADQAPEAFFAYNEALFANQPDENTPGLDNEELATIAEEAGVPADVAAGISDGTARATYGQYAYSLTNAATENPDLLNSSGSFGTPTVLVDGERFEQWGTPGALLAAAQGGTDESSEESSEG